MNRGRVACGIALAAFLATAAVVLVHGSGPNDRDQSVAATLRVPMLILHGERDYQVTSADLQGWRDALERRTDVTINNHGTSVSSTA